MLIALSCFHVFFAGDSLHSLTDTLVLRFIDWMNHVDLNVLVCVSLCTFSSLQKELLRSRLQAQLFQLSITHILFYRIQVLSALTERYFVVVSYD